MEVNSALVNLALLESLKGNKVADEIDLFVPYLALAIHSLEEDSFDIIQLKKSLNENFNIYPPEAALQVILTRAKNNGLVRFQNYQYFKVSDKLNALFTETKEKRREVEISLSILKNDFITYSNKHHNIEINETEAYSFLYEYIKNHISEFAESLSRSTNIIETKVKNKEHLTACFIKYIYEEKNERLQDLDRIIKGVLLANYITYADKITSKKTFKNVTIYLDSPIILGILGYNGPIRKRSLNEFLKLLHSLEISVCIFDVTVDEVQRIFYAWKTDLEKNKYDNFNPKTLELLRSKGLDASGLETEISLTESKIENLGVTITKYFKINEKYQCNEVAFEKHLKSWHFHNDLRHDITCISRVFNTRKNTKIKSFDKTFSIFATLNHRLEQCVNDYFDNVEIPLIASERWIATMLWVKSPNAFNDLPLNLLLSNAYSTIYSDDKFWSSFLTKLDTLKKRGGISDDDFILVRWDRSLIERVHNTSIETGEDFENEDVFDIVENIKKQHLKEKDEEIKNIETNNGIEVQSLQKEKQEIETRNQKTNENIKIISQKVASFISIIISAVIILFIFYGLFLSVPKDTSVKTSLDNLDSWWASLAIIILVISTIGNLLFGSTVKEVYFWIHKKIKKSLINILIN
ncbi:hypothetical protein AB8E32_19375 [Marinomonas polaris]|uniref:hypothetical protein n=1 Tax=Marinomonas polaris TaxID=293552 RepID=UPI0035194602